MRSRSIARVWFSSQLAHWVTCPRRAPPRRQRRSADRGAGRIETEPEMKLNIISDKANNTAGVTLRQSDLAVGVARLVARAEQRTGVGLEQEDLGRRWGHSCSPMCSKFLYPAVNASLVVGSNH